MNLSKLRIVSVGAVLGLVVALGSGRVVPVRAAVASVALAAPGTHGEGDDYFTTVWGNPRDMDDPSDLYLLHSTCGVPPPTSAWANTSYADGIWRGTTSSGTWRYWFVLNPGWASSLDIPEDGEVHKIDTSHYTQLSFRMRVQSGAAGGGVNTILWTDGPVATVQRGTQSFAVADDGQWHIYTFDLSASPTWTSAPVSSLWIQMSGLLTGYLVELDWIRLTPTHNRQITWVPDTPSGDVAVHLGSDATFADPEQESQLRIYSGGSFSPQLTPASDGTLEIPASLPAGTYFVRVEDGDGPGGGANSTESWLIKGMPIAQINAPSYTSGEDWAVAVGGNAWDMASTEDVDGGETESLTYSASAGVLDITSVDDGNPGCSAPWPHRPLGLNLHGNTIDTAKYRYLSVRYKVDDAPDQGDGGVYRVRWLSTAVWAAGRTDDISLYNNGWNVYKLDLATVPLEAETAGWTERGYNVFQIMAHESHRSWTSHLDWVKLTAENQASASYVAGWNVVQGETLTTTLYWDADRNPGGLVGATVVPTEAVGPPPGPMFSYLPLVARNLGSGAPGAGPGRTYPMATAGLIDGNSYYLVVKLEDGYNTAFWYSELPVRILP